MGEFTRWLLHEEQKEVFELFFASVYTLLFVALMALLLWPFGAAALALKLGKGLWVLWILLALTVLVGLVLRRVFRVDFDAHLDAYTIASLVASAALQTGWSAFAALAAREYAASASLWGAVVVYFVGLFSCHVAFVVVSAYYFGHLYKNVNLPLGAASFILFSLWPALARALYGWFFDLF